MFSLKLLSPHFVEDSNIAEFNQVYAEWKKVFCEVLEAKGGTLDPDDFFRNDYILTINKGDELVASCTLTMFDVRLNSSLDHHYFQALQKQTPDEIKARRLNRLISIEYLNVLPNWRKSKSDVPWVEVIIGTVLKMMDSSEADGVIGTPRIDVKVLEACKNLEAIEVQGPISKMEYPCAVVVFPKRQNRKYKNPTTHFFVESLVNTLGSKKLQVSNQKQHFKKAS